MTDNNVIKLAQPGTLIDSMSGRATSDSFILRAAPSRLLGHTKIESTVRYLGIEVDDALSIAEQVDL